MQTWIKNIVLDTKTATAGSPLNVVSAKGQKWSVYPFGILHVETKRKKEVTATDAKICQNYIYVLLYIIVYIIIINSNTIYVGFIPSGYGYITMENHHAINR